MNHTELARFEQHLGRAGRAIRDAKESAGFLGYNGMWLDLEMIEVEIVRLLDGSISGKGRKRILKDRSLSS